MNTTFLVSLAIFGLFSVVLSAPFPAAEERPTVDIAQGRVIGIAETKDNFTINSFKGVQFGEPPVNELRFQPPVPAGPWLLDVDASTNPPSCPQFIYGRENCLYLNIYTPKDALPINGSSNSLPVMVWIHGGVFLVGSARFYDTAFALVEHDVIVVAMQYRLGVLGFLSTEDDLMPGNQGLYDQRLALQWVQANIAAFGGDPNRVTIFGESAGSASVNFHMLSPLSTGLFQQAIMESGNSFLPWATGRDFLNTTNRIAETFGCPTEPTADLITCLQAVNYRTLNAESIKFGDWNYHPLLFAPRVGETFIPDEPARLMKNGSYNRVPTMMGTNKNDGALVSAEMFTFPTTIDSLVTNFATNGPISLWLFEDEGWETTPEIVYNRYLGKLDIFEEDIDNLTRLYTHRDFQMGTEWLAQLQADEVPTYLYQFSYRGNTISLIDLYQILGLDVADAEEYVAHADELPYIFQRLLLAEDQFVGDMMTKMWTDFAKTGNPTPDGSLGVVWPTAASTDLQYLDIDSTLTVQQDSHQEDRAFWESLPLRINGILNE